MALAEHYRAAWHLTPKAARLARRLINSTAGLPVAWRLSLALALTERATGASALTSSDFMVLNMLQREGTEPEPPMNTDQADAKLFIARLRDAAVQHGPHAGR